MNLSQTLADLKRCTNLIKSQNTCGMVTKPSDSTPSPKPSQSLKSFGVGFKNPPEKIIQIPTNQKQTKEELIDDAMKLARKNYSKSCISPSDIDVLSAFHEHLSTALYIPQRELAQNVLIIANRLLETEQALVRKIDDLVKKYLELSFDKMNIRRF